MQDNIISSKKHDAQLKGIRAIQRMFWNRRVKSFRLGVASVTSTTKKSRYIAGLALYLAEGTKTNSADFTNSNPETIRFMVAWFREFFRIPAESMAIQLHLHAGQDEENMRQYWSELTGISLS